MGTEPKNLVYDGWLQLKACNGANRPLSTPKDQVHRAINCIFRNDEVGPRPGFAFRQLVFADEIDQMLFDEGRWQGALIYKPSNRNAFHLVVKGGWLWKVDPYDSYRVTNVSITLSHVLVNPFNAPAINDTITIDLSDLNGINVGSILRIEGAAYEVTAINSTLVQATVRNLNDVATTLHAAGASVISFDLNEGVFFKNWMIQAEKWAIVQDGFNRALIFDGTKARRSVGLEVPTGTVMAYGLGRLWVANPDQDGFAASDLIYGSVSGTAPEGYRDSILKFTENSWLAGGNWFSVPENAGKITAMKFIANLDVVLGQGPLQVFTENGSFSVKVPANRLEWNLFGYDQDGTLGATAIDPIQTVSLKDQGAASDNCVVAINSDFFFRARDGVRTFQLSRRQFGTWANTPISQNVSWVLNGDVQALLQYSSAALFDRRYMCTCAPQVEDRGVVHKGLVSLDFENANWAEERAPDWDGLWTVSYAYQILAGNHDGNDRCFYYTRNQEGIVELFEIDLFAHNDQANATEPTKIRWMFETSEIAFPDQQDNGLFNLKKLFGGEVRCIELEDEVTFKMRWKPDTHPCWFPWVSWKECAPIGADCEYINYSQCRDWSIAKPQIRSAMGLINPPTYCDSATGLPASNFYGIQARMDIRGYCKITAIRLAAFPLSQPVIAKQVTCI